MKRHVAWQHSCTMHVQNMGCRGDGLEHCSSNISWPSSSRTTDVNQNALIIGTYPAADWAEQKSTSQVARHYRGDQNVANRQHWCRSVSTIHEAGAEGEAEDHVLTQKCLIQCPDRNLFRCACAPPGYSAGVGSQAPKWLLVQNSRS